MRLSELAGKEMIDVQTGTRRGVLGGADLWIDEETGKIESILLAAGGLPFGKKREDTVIPWNAIRKVGPDMILLDSEGDTHPFEQTSSSTGTSN
ncbi:YlmC/YmxH family sporulation protein [Tumebacillus sp. DT12]|uniref:YlmC/YmxH family sporulation protein n=1 Tax=Tumebacillus lacus TaxID=2995335 RepID=A0ABT3WV74_9BACL|nr:YlmC/YmxH family sporulation protein [Tumebacillus lacus]MCX7568574.1 YlmC/YmxH family sporulation protein [Tumebacillus lacus]